MLACSVSLIRSSGHVDADEFAYAKKCERELGQLDADGDGKVTREEWIAKYGSIDGFDQYDLGQCACVCCTCSAVVKATWPLCTFLIPLSSH